MNSKKEMSPERLERISNYARWLIENAGKGQRRGLAEAYLALEADLKRATNCHNDTLDEVRRLEARCAALEADNKELHRQVYMRGGIRYWDTGVDFHGMRVILHSDNAFIDKFKQVSDAFAKIIASVALK